MTHCTIVRLLNIDAVDDALLASFSGWLDDSEQLRSVGFIRHERRRQFLAGRILARRALGFILDRAPRDVRLVERPGFAPALVSSGGGNARFSISHSGPWIACAVTTTCGIGLDIEVIDSTRDIAALAD
jgi:4'-phosphopantetheinyl transferase